MLLRKLFLISLFCLPLLPLTAPAQKPSLSYYLPADVALDPAIPTPDSVLGWSVGEWHVSHDRLVEYMRILAASTDRISIQTIGYTHERRPLVVLTITHPDNRNRLDQIRELRQRMVTQPASVSDADLERMPAISYMGFSIHGNEPSGSNAALLTAYYLAAAQGQQMEDMLRNVIVLLDPSFNPDGLQRFSSWVNSHKSKNEVADPQNRELNEAWPRGRTNHYWFDLNRDWLPAQQPESQARLQFFHQWKPNILTDHHEMGSGSTFFFQPGVPSRNNPLTPAATFDLTRSIGTYHAAALDALGSLYYTEEDYDDFFYGKGSTYPDINGAVGILFEQASSRGHAQETTRGVLRFPFTIRNQFATTLSTLQAAYELRPQLLQHQRWFYQSARQLAGGDAEKGYVFGAPEDPLRALELVEMLRRHQIEVYAAKEAPTVAGQRIPQASSYVVPLNQPQYRLIKAMFETRREFTDSLFYDISAWTLPLAYGLPYTALNSRELGRLQGSLISQQPARPQGGVAGASSSYGYLLPWQGLLAPRALNQLLAGKLRLRVLSEPLTHEGKTFGRGSVWIPVQGQAIRPDSLYRLLQSVGEKNHLSIQAVSSGATTGVNLGSPSLQALEQPKIMVVVGDGVSSYDAGEVWHLLDQRYDLSHSLIPLDRLRTADLSRYTVIILPNGSYGSADAAGKLRDWMRAGGTLIGLQGGARWMAQNGLSNAKYKKKQNQDSLLAPQSYASLEARRGAREMGGAIFQARADITHPLFWGYSQPQISLFRTNADVLESANNPYAQPLRYTDAPLQAGYVWPQHLTDLRGTPALQISAFGSGRAIVLPDNPIFRAFWRGSERILINAIFFGAGINGRAAR